MLHHNLDLKLTEAQETELKGLYRDVENHLEKEKPLDMEVLSGLKERLSRIAAENSQWARIMAEFEKSGQDYCLHLMHSDEEILNLPWAMADGSGPFAHQQLGVIPGFYLTRGKPDCFLQEVGELNLAPAPLKVLVMVSSPEAPRGAHPESWKQRLSYEEEENALLEAFEPLMQQGLVEIDFTETGSLNALEEKLTHNHYHILHFSGHAIYNDEKNEGFLELEHPVTLEPALTPDRDFARVVNCSPQSRVPLVVLASCQTAKGGGDKGISGVTNRLMRIGVPAVLSMGMSIVDRYATCFSRFFYRKLAEKGTLQAAFQEAVQGVRNEEAAHLAKAGKRGAVPLQWIIPALYLSRPIQQVVDWRVRAQKLHLSANRYLFNRDRLLLPHEADYIFIGRRREKADILRPFMDKTPILLKGQGGVGKTAMAEHLVQRLIAAEPKTVPFVFDETVKSIDAILTALQDFLMKELRLDALLEVDKFDEAIKKFAFLVSEVAKTHVPVFVFDNLETFQPEPGAELGDEFADMKAVIGLLCRMRAFHLILTCRYPVPGFDGVAVYDLNQVGVTDFRKKCLYLDVGHINGYCRDSAAGLDGGRRLAFMDVVRVLHGAFGGNYRALEFFNRLLAAEGNKIKEYLDSMESFVNGAAAGISKAKQWMGQDLFFPRLMDLLAPERQDLLVLLAHFRVPVEDLALRMQLENRRPNEAGPESTTKNRKEAVGEEIHCIADHQSRASRGCRGRRPLPLPAQGPAERRRRHMAEPESREDLTALLADLHRLTLIEISMDRDVGAVFYYVTPIVRDLLRDFKGTGRGFSFSHSLAGGYYYHRYHNMEGGLTPLEEAFYHFDECGEKEKIGEIGERLADFYYGISMFHNAFYYAGRVFERLGEKTGPGVLNRLGMIFHLYGKYDRALPFFEKAQTAYQKVGDKSGEGTTLNNISGIYRARGDYERALQYLEKSLEIRRQIGDKSGEGTTLNNMATTAYARGNYERALQYLEKSLEIRRQIGDKSGEGTTLNNMATTAYARGNYERALQYLEKSLTIQRQIGDKSGEGATLNNMATTAYARGDYERALQYLEKSLEITRQIGDKAGEGTTLNNISQIYKARGDYERALQYLEKSLEIRRQIGDKSGEGATLNNMATISYAHGEYDRALQNFEKCLSIFQEIGNQSGSMSILHNMAIIAYQQKDIEKYLQYETDAYRIATDINDATGIFHVGRDLGDELVKMGKKKEGLAMLHRSLEIGKKAGMAGVEKIEEMIKRLESKN